MTDDEILAKAAEILETRDSHDVSEAESTLVDILIARMADRSRLRHRN